MTWTRKRVAVGVLAAGVLLLTFGLGGGVALGWALRRSVPRGVTPPAPVVVSGWSGGFVKTPGMYRLPDGRSLAITVIDGIVRFQYTASDGRVLVGAPPSPTFSDYHRWAFYLEPDGTLWMYSGDIGTYCWVPQPDGTYQLMTGPKIERPVPSELKSYAPRAGG